METCYLELRNMSVIVISPFVLSVIALRELPLNNGAVCNKGEFAQRAEKSAHNASRVLAERDMPSTCVKVLPVTLEGRRSK